MHIIQSKLTGYVNPKSCGDGDQFLVPVKGTKYINGIDVEWLRNIEHGGLSRSVDRDAAVFCGSNVYATKVAQLMGQGCPISHVQKVAAEGRAAYAADEALKRDKAEIKRKIFNTYGGWKKSYLAEGVKFWRELIETFKTSGFFEEVREQEERLKRCVLECYGEAGERPSKFRLVDVNPYYYNCGHYPEWVVKAIDIGDSGFETYAAAAAAAAAANEKSHKSWIQFLNG